MSSRLLGGVFLGLLFLALPAQATPAAPHHFALVLDTKGISKADRPVLENFVQTVSKLLPQGMKDGIGRVIRVRFSRMGHQKELAVPACFGIPTTEAASENALSKNARRAKSELLGHDQYGGHANVVDLNSLFIPEIIAGPDGTRTYPCGHHSMFRLAEATLIHELGHVYDAGLGKLQSTKNKYFQKLMGFTKQWSWSAFLFRALAPKNHLLLRSPDAYEFKNIRESFAVNLEYFLLDPQFGCRRPTVDHYFRTLFGIRTPPNCKMDTTLYENSTNPALNLKLPVNLDPSRIYDVHYLLAAKGDAMMSRWGHAMFRLIVCAPWRKTVGPKCLQDVRYHVILSYRANVQDLVLSYWKGLAGGYPSQLYVLPLPEVLTEYNKLELRDMISLPLHLTADEKVQFIDRTLEQYWEYQGRYYFLTNNCATEALNFLQGIVPDEKIQRLRELTPLGLEGDLIKTRMIDPALIANRPEAIAKGYFFPSRKPVLEHAFSQIADQIAHFRYRDFGQYVRSTSANERLEYFDALMKSTTGEDHMKTAAYFYLLESYISSVDEKSLGAEITNRIEKMGQRKRKGHSTDDHGIDEKVIRAIQAEQPWNRLSSGYGIPEPSDFDSSEINSSAKQRNLALQKLQAWIKREFADELEEFQRIQENMNTFRHEIDSPPSPETLEKP